MCRTHPFPVIVIIIAIVSVFALSPRVEAASAEPPKAGVETADNNGSLTAQVKELQKQVAALQARLGEIQRVSVVAAGTATWVRPDTLANRTTVHVNLPADVAAGLGKGPSPSAHSWR